MLCKLLGVVLLLEEGRPHRDKVQHLQDKGQQYPLDTQAEEHPGSLVELGIRVVQGSLVALGTRVVRGVRDDRHCDARLPPTN